MRVIHGLPRHPPRGGLCLGAGVFDGVHLGHREIITTAVRLARERGCAAAVLTFEPHPVAVLRGAPPPLLTTLEEKLALFRSLGVEVTVLAQFDRALAQTPPEEFVRELLVNRLNACCLTVGEGWRFGEGGHGTKSLLSRMAEDCGFAFCACPRVRVGNEVVSSTRIRTHLARGEVAEAARLLGRPYQLRGLVVRGEKRGRQLGFPTANLYPPEGKALPPDGVYAGWAGVSRFHPAVISLGVRPTFGRGGERRLEAHLLDTPPQPRLLGRRLRLAFVEHLRKERRFDSTAALVAQISDDCQRARLLLAALQPPGDML